jgi:hypothetical protein
MEGDLDKKLSYRESTCHDYNLEPVMWSNGLLFVAWLHENYYLRYSPYQTFDFDH